MRRQDNPTKHLFFQEDAMKTRMLTTVLFGVIAVFLGGCASMQSAGHEYIMRGQVLDVTDNGVYLCIGKKDGAEVGQEYAVYNFVRTGNFKTRPAYKKVDAGIIKLTEITDEHYAKAKVISGDVKSNYIVELKK